MQAASDALASENYKKFYKWQNEMQTSNKEGTILVFGTWNA